MAAAVFFKHGVIVTEIEQAHQLLTPLLGTAMASGLFAIALLASGQSSTLTGTFAGQIVMEGFLNLRLRPWLRRMITRFLAIIPAVITVYFYGAQGTLQLIILSQVILSLQLPFAVIPLIRFTSDKRRMGEFASQAWVKVLAWSVAFVILEPEFLVCREHPDTLDGRESVAHAPCRPGDSCDCRIIGMDYVRWRKSERAR